MLLVSKILQSKYFRNCSFLEARLGGRPSKIWRSLFSVQDLIRLGSRFDHIENKRVWSYNDTVFSVKSAYLLSYNMANSTHLSSLGQQSDPSRLCNFWNQIWRLLVPAKIKIFAWRVYHGALPTSLNLTRRHITRSSKCVFCALSEESDTHLFLSCWWTIVIFQNLGWSIPSESYSSVAD